jgi:hypothetical protein
MTARRLQRMSLARRRAISLTFTGYIHRAQ